MYEVGVVSILDYMAVRDVLREIVKINNKKKELVQVLTLVARHMRPRISDSVFSIRTIRTRCVPLFR